MEEETLSEFAETVYNTKLQKVDTVKKWLDDITQQFEDNIEYQNNISGNIKTYLNSVTGSYFLIEGRNAFILTMYCSDGSFNRQKFNSGVFPLPLRYIEIDALLARYPKETICGNMITKGKLKGCSLYIYRDSHRIKLNISVFIKQKID